MLEPSPLNELLQKIEGEIRRRGSCAVSSEDLLLIYDGEVSESRRFARVRDLAIRYHWAFEFSGRITSIRFKEMPPVGHDDRQRGEEKNASTRQPEAFQFDGRDLWPRNG
jgi:hypothetical protein